MEEQKKPTLTPPEGVHALPIDEKDPRFIEYMRITSHPSWYGYEHYCGDLFIADQNRLLQKYSVRNKVFIHKIDHSDTFEWALNFTNNYPTSFSREGSGDQLFEALLIIGGSINALMVELSREEFDEGAVTYFLNRVNSKRQYLPNND